MRLLLDTHTFVWFIEANPRLSQTARAAIENRSNFRFLSIVSLWEMAIKLNLGRMTLKNSFEILLTNELYENETDLLGISLSHVGHVAGLTLHHRDPFDRMLIAQAIVERLPLSAPTSPSTRTASSASGNAGGYDAARSSFSKITSVCTGRMPIL